jgi:hypothetical protein
VRCGCVQRRAANDDGGDVQRMTAETTCSEQRRGGSGDGGGVRRRRRRAETAAACGGRAEGVWWRCEVKEEKQWRHVSPWHTHFCRPQLETITITHTSPLLRPLTHRPHPKHTAVREIPQIQYGAALLLEWNGSSQRWRWRRRRRRGLGINGQCGEQHLLGC